MSDQNQLMLNSSPCIDLQFLDQQNLTDDNGSHPTLHAYCHHRITYRKFNPMIEYPPPYYGLVWNNIRAGADLNQQALNQVNWKFLFSNKSVHQQN